MQVTLGGERVGSGKKMQAHLNNYYRSTHNLSGTFASTMQCGILYPSLVKPVMRGDTFDIKIYQDTRTIPTKQALFGSFKMQTDVYFCPWRLYQGILHNNPLAIGLKMSQVLAPKIRISTKADNVTDTYSGQMNNTCLLKYLGLSGTGRITETSSTGGNFTREVLAIPALAYYDIFKNYYANKQEENAYVIGTKTETRTADINKIRLTQGTSRPPLYTKEANVNEWITTYGDEITSIRITGNNLAVNNIQIEQYIEEDQTSDTSTLEEFIENSDADIRIESPNTIQFIYTSDAIYSKIRIKAFYGLITQENSLLQFKLSNIDDMRYLLLCNNKLGDKVVIWNSTKEENKWGTNSGSDQTGLPYKTLVSTDQNNKTNNRYALNGLVLKTYQNDIFNNWLNSDWIEGENGIAELTNVQVTDGKFSMDALNFAQKLYNMLNRVAVSGGTYEDWQDVVYEEVKRRQIESPIYLGGCSHEIIFDEIIQTAPTEGSPLGTLGGRGRVIAESQKGGKIHAKIEEAGFIIAITSLTPRIYQSQGNEFYMTEIDSLDDLHKPGMDGIGFQDLIGERMAWWDTVIDPRTSNPTYRSKVGKLPAWIEYMTNVDKAYGEFANEYGKSFGMILLRNYERDEEGNVKDFTTYIDPAKYNYAFANAALDAQNFWVKIHFDIKARRLMSARLMPHV